MLAAHDGRAMTSITARRPLHQRILSAAWAAILGIFIALFGQGVWSALIAANLATTPAIPWAVGVMAVVLWLIWQYLNGRFGPQRTSESRQLRLRANALPANVFAWAALAGALSIVSLAGWWMLISRLLHLSGSVLPDTSKYPWLMTVLAVAMGTLVSPVLEQAGLWGYCQAMLEREFSGPAAIITTAMLFALLPHPPMHVPLWPKLILFFFIGLSFGVMAYLTKSILPGLLVHIFGLLAFFTLVFRNQSGQPSTDAWVWIHAVQMIVCAALSIASFAHLRRLTEPTRASSPFANAEQRRHPVG
jgi:membrane protease YdiL (CAAX protease family)